MNRIRDRDDCGFLDLQGGMDAPQGPRAFLLVADGIGFSLKAIERNVP